MNRLAALRVGALYLPMLLAGAAGLVQSAIRRERRYHFGALLLGLLWTLPALVVLQRLNQQAGWWSFAAERVSLAGVPLELLLGWTVLWGLVPQLAFPRLGLGWCAAVMAGFDLAAMPVLRPLVVPGPGWLVGEGVAVALVLLPALAIARWTQDEVRLRARAALQVLTAGLIFLYLVPEVAFSLRPGAGWRPLLAMPRWQWQLALQVVLALPGLAAVMEFVERGGGTPIPYDPPQRLVVSGVYRYCANPMQMSCAAVMAAWAGLLRNPWLLLPAAISVAYSAGIAEWDEGVDLERRFGADWLAYRREVKAWRWRWRPYAAGEQARLYMAASCGPCSELRRWLEARQPVGVQIIDAETLPAGSIRRMRYVCAGEAVEGVRATGRALEHLNAGWALAGAALRLPGVWWLVQLATDTSGLGPRELTCNVGKNVDVVQG